MTELLNGIISAGHFVLPFSHWWEETWMDLPTLPFIYKLCDHSQSTATCLSLTLATAEMDKIGTVLFALPRACEDRMRKCKWINNLTNFWGITHIQWSLQSAHILSIFSIFLHTRSISLSQKFLFPLPDLLLSVSPSWHSLCFPMNVFMATFFPLRRFMKVGFLSLFFESQVSTLVLSHSRCSININDYEVLNQ